MKSKGITLVELIIYTALLGTILTTLYQFFAQVNYQRVNQFVQTHLYTNGRRLLFDFQQTIKTAETINQPLLGQSGSTLTLDNGNLVYAVNGAGRLVKTENGESNYLNDNQVVVESLTFTHLGPSIDSPTVKIEFTLLGRHSLESGPRTESFQTAVTLR